MEKTNLKDVVVAFINIGCECTDQLRYLLYYYKAWGVTEYGIDIDDELQSHYRGPLFREYLDMIHQYGGRVQELADSLYGYGELTSDENDLLERVWVTYGDKTYNELASLSMGEAPWLIARAHCGAGCAYGDEINNEDIIRYYSNL